MAAKPIERFVKKQIAEQGGWERILERIGSGESISAIAQTFRRPDGDAISFAFFSRLLHQDPAREAPLADAKRLRAEAWADQALAHADNVTPDKDHVAKARVVVDTRLRLAGLADRAQYGEAKQQVNVQVNVEGMHLDALRHRIVEASRPLEQALAVAARADLIVEHGGAGDSEQVAPSLAHVESAA